MRLVGVQAPLVYVTLTFCLSNVLPSGAAGIGSVHETAEPRIWSMAPLNVAAVSSGSPVSMMNARSRAAQAGTKATRSDEASRDATPPDRAAWSSGASK
jgi:hypothetical protein